MISIKEIFYKIHRKWTKICLRPIRVFCFHQVSESFDETTCYHEDWLPLEKFKNETLSLLDKKYIFISLMEAHYKLKHDRCRWRKYVVLTADDGDASLRNILPWLHEKNIPITLFINPIYMDGKHFRIRDTEQYLTDEEVKQMYMKYPLLSIGSHGWEHKDAKIISLDEFKQSVLKSDEYLRCLPNYVPFFAFTYGSYTQQCLSVVEKAGLVPVLINGNRNYKLLEYIDRELL